MALDRAACKAGFRFKKVFQDDLVSLREGRRVLSMCGIVGLLDSQQHYPVLVTKRDHLLNSPLGNALKELERRGQAVVSAASHSALRSWRRKNGNAIPKEERPPAPPALLSSEEKKRAIVTRLLNGRRQGALEGRSCSGPAPYGYTRNAQKLLVPHEDEAPVLRLVFQTYLELKSMSRVAVALNEQGYRTRRNVSWSRAGVGNLLKNQAYIGRVRFADVDTKGLHEPLIDPETFRKVQRLIREGKQRRGRKRGWRAAVVGADR